MSWTPSQLQSRAQDALRVWKMLPANGNIRTLKEKIEAGRELARIVQQILDTDPPKPVVIDPFLTAWSFSIEDGLEITAQGIDVVIDGSVTRGQLIAALEVVRATPDAFTDLIGATR